MERSNDQGDDQGDRSLISYFERGREIGVRATSVFSCAINPLKLLPYFIYDSIGQSADTNHLTWTCSKFTHHVTDYIFLSIQGKARNYKLQITNYNKEFWKKIDKNP